MTKNILFRADSSSAIGTGHIMRDLGLAEQYSDANIIFATQELTGNVNHKIKEADIVTFLVGHDEFKGLDIKTNLDFCGVSNA